MFSCVCYQTSYKHFRSFSRIRNVVLGGIPAFLKPLSPYPFSGRITAIRSPPSLIAVHHIHSTILLRKTLSTPGQIFATAISAIRLIGRECFLEGSAESMSSPLGNSIVYLLITLYERILNRYFLSLHRNGSLSDCYIFVANIIANTLEILLRITFNSYGCLKRLKI